MKDLLREEYKELLFNQLERKKQSANVTLDELVQQTLDLIISISSKRSPETNSIKYIFLYINNDDEIFTNKYISSTHAKNFGNEYYKSQPLSKASQRLNKGNENKKTIKNISFNYYNPILIHELAHNTFKIFHIEGQNFNELTDINVGDFFLFSYKQFKKYVKDNKLPGISNSIALIPMNNLIIEDSDRKIGGLCFIFFDEDRFQNLSDIKDNFKISELELISTLLLSFSEIAYDYAKEKAIENEKISNALKEVSKLYLHSFGSFAQRIDNEIVTDSDNIPIRNRITKSNLIEIYNVAKDIELVKQFVLKKMSNIDFRSYINVISTLKNYIFIKPTNDYELSSGFLNRDIINFYPANNYKTILCRMDRQIFTIICDTIIDNALKATCDKDEKKIMIDFKKDNKNQKVSILFYDNGVGVDDKIIRNAFKTKPKSIWKNKKNVGNGVGLYLCKVLLKIFNGNITIEKETSLTSYNTKVKIDLPTFR